MTNENQKKPTKLTSILDALGDRAEEVPEPTIDEITQQAIREAHVEQVMNNQTTIPPQIKPAEQPKLKIPVSNIESQPVIPNSIPDSPAKQIPINNEDLPLRRLLDYVSGGEFSKGWVLLHLAAMSTSPKMMPSVTLWDIPGDFDISKAVYEVIKTPGFVENIYPSLRVIMGK